MRNRFLPVILAFFVLLACTRQGGERMFRKTTFAMDTMVTVTVVSKSEDKAGAAIEAAFREIRRLERLLSFWTRDSEIAAINREAGRSPVNVSPETLEIVERALQVSRLTGGAFDPTIGPVIRLWDFRKKIKPGPEAVKEALARVGYRAIEVDRQKRTVYLSRADMSFDTGGIAKGYAADKAVQVLKQKGIRAGLVSVAGDIRAFGTKPDGGAWSVGIRNPRPEAGGAGENELIAVLPLRDQAVSTSGDYERYFIRNGVRYHHLLDPRTGYPARGLVSVTVVAPEAVLTDGLATGVFVMGRKKGLELLEKNGFEGVLVDEEGKRYVTAGLEGRIQWVSPKR
ncbi:MAG: FAD:protein FMN transferase [Nitrospirota bacterium]